MSNVFQLALPAQRAAAASLADRLPAPVPVQVGARRPGGGERLLRLPEGAVVTPWPHPNLPEIEGIGAGTPMVGYLVLVPGGAAPSSGVTSSAAQSAPSAPSTLTVLGFPGAVAATPAPAAAAPSGEPVTRLRPAYAELPDQAVDHGIQLDPEQRTARIDGTPLVLTYLEFELLTHLTAHPHRVHTRDHLVTAVWGYGHVGDGRTVDVHVARLRRKLGAEYRQRIVTVRRVGYKYVPPRQG